MINTFVVNYVFVLLSMSLQMCLNIENNIEEDKDIYDKYLLDDKDIVGDSKANDKIAYRIDSYTKQGNNTRNISDIDVEDYSHGSDTSEMLNEIDEDDCDGISKERIALFKFAREKQEDESEEGCDDCIPGLLKGDMNTKSKGSDKVNDEIERPKQDFEIKIETKRENKITEHNYTVDSFQNEEKLPVLLNRQESDSKTYSSNANLNNEVEDLKPKKPYLRVVNGRPAELGDVPYQVSFKMLRSRRRNEFVSFCGGVIIGPTKLVSAAHCFEGGRKPSACQRTGSRKANKRTLRQTQVVAGNLQNLARYNDGGQWRTLRSMYYPIKYKFPTNDISVGYVRKAFIFNTLVNKVPFENKFVDYGGRVCLVSGYGRINKYQMSDKLLLADLTLLSNAACSKLHHRRMKKFICTDNVPSDIEKGDSGGPLVCSGTLVGIVSGHRYGSGSFFTRVSTHSKYIRRGEATMLAHNPLIHFVHVLILIFTI